MAKSAKALFAEMCREAGMDEQSTAALTAAASSDKLAPKLDLLIKQGTDDYNAALGRVRALEQRSQQYDQWYATAQPQYAQAMTELEQYRAANGNGANGNGNGYQPDFDASKYMTKEDFAAAQKERDSRYSAVIKEGLRIASRHAVDYNEELDAESLEKIATEKNLPLTLAYDEMTKSRREEKQRAAFEKEKKEYGEQQVRDYASKNKMPVDARPIESAPLFRNKSAEPPKDIDADLLATWHGVGASK